eukprot:3673062-Rhodomonas_salina.2
MDARRPRIACSCFRRATSSPACSAGCHPTTELGHKLLLFAGDLAGSSGHRHMSHASCKGSGSSSDKKLHRAETLLWKGPGGGQGRGPCGPGESRCRANLKHESRGVIEA